MDRQADTEIAQTRISIVACRIFGQVEDYIYIVLGVVLALAAVLGIVSSSAALWSAVQQHGDSNSLVVTIDRLLFVLMVVEILRTVRVSIRSGALVSEPFLVVGLIASIRRILVITLESSRATQQGNWTPEAQGHFNSTMLELGVLGGLILILVVSIYLLRRRPPRSDSPSLP
jgi:uncharacterized membrane protein (DUF373 family)